MRIVNVLLLFLVVLEHVIAQDYDQDWPNLNRYKNENAKLILTDSNKNRIVFMGNSITEEWKRFQPEFFSDNKY
ncbi:uncharacterized protein METZ01_LOCUS123161, partial [marine metagenome]